MPQRKPETAPAAISALYLHVPFCASRCNYCDFTTFAASSDDPLLDEYAMALGLIVRRASRAGLLGDVKTVYLGGGTPSFLGNRRLSSLVYLITTHVDVGYDTEFTLEANPDSLDERMVHDLWALGVNRWSLGVQSFDDAVLRILGRRHDADGARRAIALLADRDANVSIDLMCGIPGQSASSWEASLAEAASCGARHVSIYPLTIEDGTPFSRAVACGSMPAPDDDVEADMMLAASGVLDGAGFRRYEVASYARQGFESRHNEAYWTGVPYLGLGVAAASMVTPSLFQALCAGGIVEEVVSDREGCAPEDAAIVRMTCAQDAAGFSSAVMSGLPMKVRCERLTQCERMAESLMLRMRMTRGVAASEVADARRMLPDIVGVFDHLEDEGLVRLDVAPGGRYVPTERGWLLGNVMFGEIWDARGPDC